MKILHIINKLNDVYAWQAVYRQKRKEENTIEVLLLHDAVYSQVQEEVEVMASKDDVLARGVETQKHLVDYEEIVKMVLASDTVVCW